MQSPLIRLVCFFAFEVCCGVYFPASWTLRSQTFPEGTRAAVINIFRVPLNALVLSVLLQKSLQVDQLFRICAFWQLMAALVLWFAFKAPKAKSKRN
jgi:hypothetical protein